MAGLSAGEYGPGAGSPDVALTPVVGRGAGRRARPGGTIEREQPQPSGASTFEQFIRGIDWARLDPMSPTDCLRTPVDDQNYNGG